MATAYTVSPKVAKRLQQCQPMLIDGHWCQAKAGATLPVFNPSSAKQISESANGNESDVDAAVAAARASFDSGIWRKKTPAQRAKILWKVADLLEEHSDELAELEMLDAGKFYAGAQAGEIPFAAECFRYFAGWCTKLEGQTKQLSIIPGLDFHAYTMQEPVGVAALIVPWNGPLVQAAWKVAPALAAGCSCILKPAEETPLSTVRLAEILVQAGVPAGVFNLVLGEGTVVGARLAEHPDVDKVSFTGSTAVGKHIIDAAKGNLKKVSLELGGKSPVIIFADADLDQAITGAAQAIFSNAGQVCVAGSRLYIEESVFEQVISGVAEIARNMRVGPATEEGFDMGPLISRKHQGRVCSMIEQGIADGATVLAGGKALSEQEGYFVEPTVLTQVSQQMDIVQQEVFGPVLVAMPFKQEEDIIALANDSDFGLAASIWTENVSKAHKTAAQIKAGLLWVNCHGIPDMAVPFGGYKQSGWGRENGYEALQQYTQLKSVVVKL